MITMSYKIQLLRSAEKDIKQLDKPIRRKIREELLKLSSDPSIGQKLKGNLSIYWSHHFNYDRVDYRIIYEIIEYKLVIEIVMVGSRENIYQQLLRRI